MPVTSRAHCLVATVLALSLIVVLTTVVVGQEASPTASEVPLVPAETATAQPGGDWDVLAFDAWGGGLVEPAPGSTFTVSFLPGGRLEGLSGCGQYHGVWSLDGDRINLHVVSKGPDPCGTKKTEEAVAFSVAVDQASTWHASESGLELLDDAGGVRALLAQASTVGPSGEWLVKRYAKPNGVVIEPPIDEPIRLVLDEAGGVSGTTGCRLLEGSYESESDRIVIAPVDTVGLPCEGDLRKVERRLLLILDEVVLWERKGEVLRLLTGAGDRLLVLRAVEPAASPSPEPSPTPAPSPTSGASA